MLRASLRHKFAEQVSDRLEVRSEDMADKASVVMGIRICGLNVQGAADEAYQASVILTCVRRYLPR